ncbi:MAG TPA: TonB-dependent receptor [Bryobacteraceae bacterium]|nr:TonB-dependent receptor [Bryobacteraceae bacterium]
MISKRISNRNSEALIRCFGIVVFLLLFALTAFGQGNRGSITGTITDPGGGVTPNAAIDVKNVDTGELFHGGTSSTGNYVIPVPAGKYEMTVNVTGFKKYVRTNIEVVTATDTREDVKLELGATTETITVTDEAPLLKTESGELSHTMTTDDVNQLPVLTTNGNGGSTGTGNIRNPLQEIVLLPGTAFQNDTAVVVNGLPANSENIRIEGQDSTSNIWKIAQQNSQGGVDAIQEVAIQTSNFNAEYGQAAGGYFNYTMKSGTNQFHGSGYDYFVNEFLDAGSPFTDRCTQSGLYCTDTADRQHIRNRVRRNDYGFTFGGPVRIPKLYNGRNRTFFFVNFEQFRQNNLNGTSTTTVPTPAYRAGNFSTALCSSYIGGAADGTGGVCTPYPAVTQGGKPAVDPNNTTLVQGMIFNPYSTTTVGGQQVRVPFSNNTIPASLQDSVALAVQKLLPLPNAPGDVNNYNIPAYRSFQHTTNFSVKMDQSISSTIKVSGYYSQLNTYQPNVDGGITPLFLGGADTNQWNHTIRLNYDETITPTLLLHVGVGYFETSEPHIAPPFDQSTIGLKGYQANNIFPDISGLYSATGGGYGGPVGPFGPAGGVGSTFSAEAYEEKPTANSNLTWIRGNHTFKAGADYTQEGYPTPSLWRANGNFTFSAAETSDPWQNIGGFSAVNPTGFGYASFLTGLPDVLNLNAPTDSKLGYHSLGVYIQDSWKVTRKLTVDYGLRYDYQTFMKEQYGRMQDASFGTQDTRLGRPGALLYGASCKCEFSHNYPYAFGPRLGAAYQIDSKTVLRGGAGVQYDVAEAPNGVLYSAADFYTINPNGYGISPLQNTANPAQNGLQGGNAYAPGNPFGNPAVVWPNLDQNKYPFMNNGIAAPSSPFIFFDPQNRPGRTFTWSIGVQREVMKNLVGEIAYVGNRGAWFPAPNMSQIASNSLTPALLLSQFGIDFNNPNDRALLTQQVSSAAVQARFPQLKLVNVNGTPTVPSVYPGFPATQTLIQALKNVPQWGNVPPWLGPPLGKTWYDSMQVKVTKRYSSGLQAQGNFTWAKGLVIGSASDSTYFLTNQAATTDIYNYGVNKQLNQYVRPLAMTITFSYTTPKFSAASFAMKALSQATRDWQLSSVLRYQSGALIGLPASNNNLLAQLGRTSGSTGNNYWNLTGQPLLKFDPNCGCFNPQTTGIFNLGAISDAPGGTWSTAAPYYNNIRWQRQPAESMAFARNFRLGPAERNYVLQIRAEFQNIFNRLFLSMPAVALTNPNLPIVSTTYAGNVLNSSGYGSIATLNGAGAQQRSGQIIVRFSF